MPEQSAWNPVPEAPWPPASAGFEPAPASGGSGQTLDPPVEHWATSSWAPITFEPANRPASSVDGFDSPPPWSGNNEGRLAPVWDEPVVWSDTAPAPVVPPQRPRQSRAVTFGMAVLGVVALAAIALTGIVYYSGPDSKIPEMLQLGNGGGTTSQAAVSAPLDGRTIGSFELLAATDRVRVRIADLGTDLYRISAAEGAGIYPNAELRDDAVRLDLTRDADKATGGEIEVLLAAEVRWTLRFSGYAAERVLDLSEGRVSGIEVVGGTRRAEVTLAKATGTVPMKITGGVEELLLRAPASSPVRVKVGGGASTVTAGARTLRDVPPGSTLTPKDWQNADRYDVDAVAPITLLTVENAK